jgi:hypothetical protein
LDLESEPHTPLLFPEIVFSPSTFIAMSTDSTTKSEDGSKLLLNHDDELPSLRWQQDNPRNRSWIYTLIFIATLLSILLTIFFVLYLPLNAAFGTSIQNSTEPPAIETALPASLNRDLKFLLHPEDHVSRDPEIRRYVWNITKAIRAPDGVEKEVFLINGKSSPSKFLFLDSR